MTAKNAEKRVERQTQTGGWREANRRVGRRKVRNERVCERLMGLIFQQFTTVK